MAIAKDAGPKPTHIRSYGSSCLRMVVLSLLGSIFDVLEADSAPSACKGTGYLEGSQNVPGLLLIPFSGSLGLSPPESLVRGTEFAPSRAGKPLDVCETIVELGAAIEYL